MFCWTRLLACLLLVAPTSVFAAEIGPTPNWVIERELPQEAAVPEDQVSNGTHYLLVDTQVDGRDSYSRFFRLAARVLDANGVEFMAQVSADFDPAYQSLTWHWIRVVRNGEVINQLNADSLAELQRETDMERSIFDGHLTSLQLLTDLRPGDTVDYGYSVNGRNPVLSRFSSSIRSRWSVPIEQMRYRALLPKHKPLQQRNMAADYFSPELLAEYGQPPALRVSDGGGHYVVELDANQSQPFLFSNTIPSEVPIGFRWQLSNYQDWAEVRAWAEGLFEPTIQQPDSVASLLTGLAKSSNGRFHKVTQAIRFVQDDIRYTGIEMGAGSYQPSSPDVTLERRFGDCKDKSVLLTSMLRQLGLEANVALVSSSEGSVLLRSLPGHWLFDHAIVHVQYQGQSVWIDPTMNFQGGTFPDLQWPDYRAALVLDGQSTALRRIQMADLTSPDRDIGYEFVIHPIHQGSAELVVKSAYLGRAADRNRAAFASKSKEQLSQDYQNYYQRWYPQLSSTADIQIKDDRERNVLKTIESYAIEDIWEADGDTQVSATFAAAELSSFLTDPTTTQTKLPMALSHPNYMRQRLTAKLPSDWPQLAEDTVIEGPGFTFKADIDMNEEVLTMDYEYRSLASSVAASDLGTYQAKVDEADEWLEYYVSHTAPGVSSVEAVADELFSDGVNRELFLVLVLGFIIAIPLLRAAWRYDPEPVPIRPDESLIGLGGWMIPVVLFVCLSGGLSWIGVAIYPFVFSGDSWQTLGEQTSNLAGISGQSLLIVEVIAYSILAALKIVMIVLMFKRRSSFPGLLVAVSFTTIAWEWLSWSLASGIAELKELTDASELIGGTIQVVIWSAYLLNSTRVASTFRARYNDADTAPQNEKAGEPITQT